MTHPRPRRHQLTEIDPKQRTAYCSHCKTTVRIHFKKAFTGPKTGTSEFICARMPPRLRIEHRLTEIDLGAMTGHCSTCRTRVPINVVPVRGVGHAQNVCVPGRLAATARRRDARARARLLVPTRRSYNHNSAPHHHHHSEEPPPTWDYPEDPSPHPLANLLIPLFQRGLKLRLPYGWVLSLDFFESTLQLKSPTGTSLPLPVTPDRVLEGILKILSLAGRPPPLQLPR